MDLKSILRNEAGENSVSKQVAPVTPVQAHPQQGFHREYSHPQASPGKHPSQDYGAQAGGPYNSPTAYQASYQGRPPPPPPIQAPPQNDLRSPVRTYSAQSPYQHTPSSSGSQYPFPSSYQTPQSPAQHQQPQYPPTVQQRDSYPQTSGPPHLQHQSSYPQASPAPQTPPIGIPGAPHPILQHQRSQSSLSTSTPTSAHSQQQYFSNQYSQESPVSTTTPFPPSQIAQHQRQQSQQSQHSQPGTPLGPPLNQRQSSGPFAQPSSPYQQRGIPPGPFAHYQTSPAQPSPASIPRLPSTPSTYDPHSQRTSTSEQHRRSQSERERSISVSPKTRLPSQPRGEIVTPQSENGYNSAKRKMEDRNAVVEEPRRIYEQEIKPQVNGDNKSMSNSPQQPPKKRIRYTEPPIWARSVRNKAASGPSMKGNSKINGKLAVGGLFPANQAPPSIKTETNGNRQVSPAVSRAVLPPSVAPDNPELLLGPFEESITNNIPKDEISKLVADFLFVNVVSRGDLGELASRGVEIEIEAKLGQLIDRETNERFYLPAVNSECVLKPSQGIAFKSSMTETQHRFLNDFLNRTVVDTNPSNPQAEGRVKVDYKHRRERDSFYELPPTMQANLPAAVREMLKPRHTVKVRISHDQKTGQVLAKIIKARIVDLDIYMPHQPLDCRISINFEMKYEGEVEEIIASSIGDRQPDRNKDRLSYSQSHYQIDLTQVSQTRMQNGSTQNMKEHELEIEVNTAAIREQGQRARANAPNQYLTLVGGLVNNVRVLARATPPP